MPQFYSALYTVISYRGTLGCTLELRHILFLDTFLWERDTFGGSKILTWLKNNVSHTLIIYDSGNADLVYYSGVYQGRTRFMFSLYARLGPAYSGFSNTRISRVARQPTCYPPYSGLGSHLVDI